jgi:hypothetical protein
LWFQLWWCPPVIPGQERLRQENYKFEASLDYIERKEKKKESQMWQCTAVIPAAREMEVGRGQSKASLGKNTSSYLKKKPKSKRTGGVAQVVEHLPSKCKSLSSNPTTAKINKLIQ